MSNPGELRDADAELKFARGEGRRSRADLSTWIFSIIVLGAIAAWLAMLWLNAHHGAATSTIAAPQTMALRWFIAPGVARETISFLGR